MKTFQISYKPNSVRYAKKDHWSGFESGVALFNEKGFAMSWGIRSLRKVGTIKMGDRVLVYKTGQKRNGLVGVAHIFKIDHRLGYIKRLYLVFSAFQLEPIPIQMNYNSFASSINPAKINIQVKRAIDRLLKDDQ